MQICPATLPTLAFTLTTIIVEYSPLPYMAFLHYTLPVLLPPVFTPTPTLSPAYTSHYLGSKRCISGVFYTVLPLPTYALHSYTMGSSFLHTFFSYFILVGIRGYCSSHLLPDPFPCTIYLPPPSSACLPKHIYLPVLPPPAYPFPFPSTSLPCQAWWPHFWFCLVCSACPVPSIHMPATPAVLFSSIPTFPHTPHLSLPPIPHTCLCPSFPSALISSPHHLCLHTLHSLPPFVPPPLPATCHAYIPCLLPAHVSPALRCLSYTCAFPITPLPTPTCLSVSLLCTFVLFLHAFSLPGWFCLPMPFLVIHTYPSFYLLVAFCLIPACLPTTYLPACIPPCHPRFTPCNLCLPAHTSPLFSTTTILPLPPPLPHHSDGWFTPFLLPSLLSHLHPLLHCPALHTFTFAISSSYLTVPASYLLSCLPSYFYHCLPILVTDPCRSLCACVPTTYPCLPWVWFFGCSFVLPVPTFSVFSLPSWLPLPYYTWILYTHLPIHTCIPYTLGSFTQRTCYVTPPHSSFFFVLTMDHYITFAQFASLPHTHATGFSYLHGSLLRVPYILLVLCYLRTPCTPYTTHTHAALPALPAYVHLHALYYHAYHTQPFSPDCPFACLPIYTPRTYKTHLLRSIYSPLTGWVYLPFFFFCGLVYHLPTTI